MARFKVYHAAKVISAKYDDRNDKKFNPHKLSKTLAAAEKGKAAAGITENAGAVEKFGTVDNKPETGEPEKKSRFC